MRHQSRDEAERQLSARNVLACRQCLSYEAAVCSALPDASLRYGVYMLLRRLTIATVFGLTLLSGQAWAETVKNDDLKVSMDRPAGWSNADGNDRAVFMFKRDGGHSQLEVIATQLMTSDVAGVFFDTFHETLGASDFTRAGREERKIGNISGTETVYTFAHAGVNLKVYVFQFVKDTSAYVVVSYMETEKADALLADYQSAISSLKFEE